MKFGKHLQAQMDPEWSIYYLDYHGLKKLVKQLAKEQQELMAAGGMAGSYDARGTSLSVLKRGNDGGVNSNESGEVRFLNKLDAELDKLNNFTSMKGNEIRVRVADLQSRVAKANVNDAESVQALQEAIDRCGRDLLRLEKFVNINFTGFIKICKKHDKFSQVLCKPYFLVKLRSQPFLSGKYGDVIVQLSSLTDILRGDSTNRTRKAAGEGAQNFVRKTTKYWVRLEDVTRVKWLVLQHLPLYQFKKSQNDADLISSVYFDNDAMTLYQGRLEKTDGAIAFRIRWYGSEVPEEVFIERKTHKDSWAGEVSVKERFPLKRKHVMDFLRGTYKKDKIVAKMRAENKKEKDIAEFQTLFDEIQQVVDTKQLVPKVRTQYCRTAFQLPNDATVRVSLDTNLCMVKEVVQEGQWYRDQHTVSDSDICKFPHAVLEIKLQTQAGEDPPQWVSDLVESGLLFEVHKFSKYIHGSAHLLREDVQALPPWLDLVNEPRPEWGAPPDAPPVPRSTHGTPAPPRKVEMQVHAANSSSPPKKDAGWFGKRKADPESQPLLGDVEQGNRSSAAGASSSAHYGAGVGGSSSYGAAPSSQYQAAPQPQPQQQVQQQPDTRRVYTGSRGLFNCFGPKKLPTKVPMRVEPKTFFANERTFLSWLHMAVLMATVSVGIIGFGDKVSRVGGMALLGVGLVFTVYALCIFHWRALRIRSRASGPYDDRFGPTMLVILLVAALIFNFVVNLKNLESSTKHHAEPITTPA